MTWGQNGRSKQLMVAVVLLFLVLVVRLGYLQIGQRSYYRNLSEENRVQLRRIPALRGKILDCRGEILASNRPSFRIRHNPSRVEMERGKVVKLAHLSGTDWRALAHRLREQYRNRIPVAVSLVEDAGLKAVARVEEHLLDFPSIFVDYRSVRSYEHSRLAAHLLGYVSEITKEELRQPQFDGYYLGDVIGRSGLEQLCEKRLRGRYGWKQLEVDAHGREIRVLDRKESRPGDDVFLTIDARIQRIVEEVFGDGYCGAVVVMDPQNGAILAMLSKPDFDPNLFVGGIDPEGWKRLTEDERRPLFNRVIQGTYPPGSLFKVITAAAALEEGVTDQNRIIVSTGEFRIGNEVFKDWKEEGHGETGILKAIAHSVNTYFYQVGYELGVDALSEYARKFGLGKPTGIDVPGEKGGFVPMANWKKETLGESWYPGDAVNMSIGQGFILVTPLQVANMFSAIANGGILYKPGVIQKIVSEDGRMVYTFEKQVLGEISLSDTTLWIIREGLERAVREGTARYPFMGAKVEVAGKTGTAENPEGEPHAWFVGYTPCQNPRLLVAVLVEHGEFGARTAGKVARQILEKSSALTLKRERGKGRANEDFQARGPSALCERAHGGEEH